MDNVINYECEFQIEQTVEIITGLYKGYKGKIKSYDNKSKNYGVVLKVDERLINVIVNPNHIRKATGWFK